MEGTGNGRAWSDEWHKCGDSWSWCRLSRDDSLDKQCARAATCSFTVSISVGIGVIRELSDMARSSMSNGSELCVSDSDRGDCDELAGFVAK